MDHTSQEDWRHKIRMEKVAKARWVATYPDHAASTAPHLPLEKQSLKSRPPTPVRLLRPYSKNHHRALSSRVGTPRIEQTCDYKETQMRELMTARDHLSDTLKKVNRKMRKQDPVRGHAKVVASYREPQPLGGKKCKPEWRKPTTVSNAGTCPYGTLADMSSGGEKHRPFKGREFSKSKWAKGHPVIARGQQSKKAHYQDARGHSVQYTSHDQCVN